jgi:hypothetical protein
MLWGSPSRKFPPLGVSNHDWSLLLPGRRRRAGRSGSGGGRRAAIQVQVHYGLALYDGIPFCRGTAAARPHGLGCLIPGGEFPPWSFVFRVPI